MSDVGREAQLNAIALESSGKFLSFALLKEGTLRCVFHRQIGHQHEVVFWREFPKVLKRSDFKLDRLDFVSVSRGPGRFTGIRFALGIALSWAYVFRVPIFAPSVLDLLAWQAEAFRGRDTRLILKKASNLFIPRADSLLAFALNCPKKHWFKPRHPTACLSADKADLRSASRWRGHFPEPLYLKQNWK